MKTAILAAGVIAALAGIASAAPKSVVATICNVSGQTFQVCVESGSGAVPYLSYNGSTLKLLAGSVPSVTDNLTVTATDTLSSLSHTPIGAVSLNVNGQIFRSTDPTPAFSISGTSVTWNATAVQVDLLSTDTVTATYNQ